MKEKFSIGQKVTVLDSKTTGEVQGIYEDANGIDYNVLYVDSNGRYDSRYFKAHQLKPAT